MASNSSSPPSSPRRSRWLVLLRKVINGGALRPSEVARALVISDSELAAYLAESTPMPLDRQLRLASLVIRTVPSLARLGHQLRGQASAAMSFEAHATLTHPTSHPKTGW